MLKAPEPDPGLDSFRDGIAVLRGDGEAAGHVASSVGTFWSPSKPLSKQWSVWLIVIWANGDRERAFEDYPPWTVVDGIRCGTLVWDEPGQHGGVYTVDWLTGDDRQAARSELGIKPEDF